MGDPNDRGPKSTTASEGGLTGASGPSTPAGHPLAPAGEPVYAIDRAAALALDLSGTEERIRREFAKSCKEPAPVASEPTGDELARLPPGLAADKACEAIDALARAASSGPPTLAAPADALALTLAAEQSIRGWLRAHGHDPDARPWDETVIALLTAPPVGSVAGLLAWTKEARKAARADRGPHMKGIVAAYYHAEKMIKGTLAAPVDPVGKVLAEVMARRPTDAHGTDLRAGTTPEKHATIAAGVLRAKSGRFPLTTRDKLIRGAAVCIAGSLACDAAKGGAK